MQTFETVVFDVTIDQLAMQAIEDQVIIAKEITLENEPDRFTETQKESLNLLFRFFQAPDNPNDSTKLKDILHTYGGMILDLFAHRQDITRTKMAETLRRDQWKHEEPETKVTNEIKAVLFNQILEDLTERLTGVDGN